MLVSYSVAFLLLTKLRRAKCCIYEGMLAKFFVLLLDNLREMTVNQTAKTQLQEIELKYLRL